MWISVSLTLRNQFNFARDFNVISDFFSNIFYTHRYQYKVCPFCNKTRAYLDYHKIPYEIVEVNPVFKTEKRWSEYKLVPFTIINHEQVNGSLVIINHVHKILQRKGLVPPTQTEEDVKWQLWADDVLVHLLPPNIYRTTDEAFAAFDYITREGKFNPISVNSQLQ